LLVEDFIIETKGRANDSFPLRYGKCLNTYMVHQHGDKRTLYKPQNQNVSVMITIKLILKQQTTMTVNVMMKEVGNYLLDYIQEYYLDLRTI
jgi:hypothetical protein